MYYIYISINKTALNNGKRILECLGDGRRRLYWFSYSAGIVTSRPSGGGNRQL